MFTGVNDLVEWMRVRPTRLETVLTVDELRGTLSTLVLSLTAWYHHLTPTAHTEPTQHGTISTMSTQYTDQSIEGN